MPEGQITKALSGFYYVKEVNDNRTWQCRARGVFKNKGIHPLVGDHVLFEPSTGNEGTVVHIFERKNELVRPPIANVDQALLVFSIDEPLFSTLLLDKLLVHVEKAGIEPVICLSKMDLNQQNINAKDIDMHAYEQAGYKVFKTSGTHEQGIKKLIECMKNKISVFAGQSGVGKSTLLNVINPQLSIETQEISSRLGRGRHTTRHVELLPLLEGGLVADTPGFSQLDFNDFEPEELGELFIEFESFAPSCKFRGCVHQNEPKCAVKKAVEEGEIAQHRYDHYEKFLNEIKGQKRKY